MREKYLLCDHANTGQCKNGWNCLHSKPHEHFAADFDCEKEGVCCHSGVLKVRCVKYEPKEDYMMNEES